MDLGRGRHPGDGTTLARERPPLVTLGLFDTNPRSGYERRVAAFAAGDDKAVMAGTASRSQLLMPPRPSARDVRRRPAAAAVVFLLLVLLVVVLVRRRRRHRPLTGASPLAWASASGVMVDDVPPAPTEVRSLRRRGAAGRAPPPPRRRFETADVPPPPDAVRRLDTAPSASPGDASGLAAADPYATLAATPNGVDDVPTEEPGARGAEPD